MNKRPTPPERPAREKVLVALHGDGFVECYAERYVDCHLVNVPYTGTTEGERLADENLPLMLPRCYRDLHEPGKLRAHGKHRRMRPSRLIEREHELALLQGLNALQQAIAPPVDNAKGGTIWIL